MVQAEQQLGPGWTLMRGGTPKCPEIQDWLASSLPAGGRVGIDPFLHTVMSSLTCTATTCTQHGTVCASLTMCNVRFAPFLRVAIPLITCSRTCVTACTLSAVLACTLSYTQE